MKLSKPFLFCLALVSVCGATVLLNAPTAHAAPTEQGIPLSTALTPVMVDYFGLQVAYDHPSIAALVACHGQPACGQSDSSQVRIFDATGVEVKRWDGKPGSVIEQVRQVQGATTLTGESESRRMLRRYATDKQGNLIMNGSDSIVRVTAGSAGREATRITQVNRYTGIRYLLTNPRFVWPMAGLVVLEISSESGAQAQGPPTPTVAHAAASFDGSAQVQILTTGSLRHTADLQGKRLDTTMPDRD